MMLVKPAREKGENVFCSQSHLNLKAESIHELVAAI
jgi:hypothetical protein